MNARPPTGLGGGRFMCVSSRSNTNCLEERAEHSAHPLLDGHAVSRFSDFIIYSVEAEFIDRVVAQFGPSTKLNAIVAGQTSVKAPKRVTFENTFQGIHTLYHAILCTG
ncbi:hypothetical protein BD779DRAFT_110157 [Infundibulicybe gibba]|nr:hypothetical protein BD779DRAFT_110157 [Infundibulicybe gibba]